MPKEPGEEKPREQAMWLKTLRPATAAQSHVLLPMGYSRVPQPQHCGHTELDNSLL